MGNTQWHARSHDTGASSIAARCVNADLSADVGVGDTWCHRGDSLFRGGTAVRSVPSVKQVPDLCHALAGVKRHG
jgi:hypothetical protein